MYYAGFNFPATDVAVFETEEKRDAWLAEKSFFDKVPLSEDIVMGIVNIDSELMPDPLTGEKMWFLNIANYR